MPGYQTRLVCGTAFNITEFTVDMLGDISYIAWGNEVCPTTNKPHLQFWAYGKKMTPKKWRELLKPHHVESMQGSIYDNDKYCSKQAELKFIGEKPMISGHKRSFQEVCNEVVLAAQTSNKMPAELAVEREEFRTTYVQYSRGLEKLALAAASVLAKKRFNEAPAVIYVYGPARSGKSRLVRERDPDVYQIPIDDQYKWKDGYMNHEAVSYENLSVKNVNADRMCIELDRYPCQVAVKGGMVWWNPRRIYITSVCFPGEIAALFTNPQEFLGRITETVCTFDFSAPTPPSI